jgi:hypothetical protein
MHIVGYGAQMATEYSLKPHLVRSGDQFVDLPGKARGFSYVYM